MSSLIRKIISIILISSFFVINFAACGNSDEGKITTTEISTTKMNSNGISTCFLLGNTQNVKLPRKKVFEEKLSEVAENNGTYSVIILDGNPNTLSHEEELIFPKKFGIQESNNKAIIQEELGIITNLIPAEPEIDILKGLYSAYRTLNETDGKKQLFIFSSGISTEGALNFASNPEWIHKNPTKIVDILKSNNSLPDLSGIDITWYGLGDVCGSQKELSDLNLYCLKNIWAEILKACNVNVNEDTFNTSMPVDGDELLNDSAENYPTVTPVDFKDVVEINDEDLGFNANSSEFYNKEKAIETLEYYAEYIKGTNRLFYIVGSTATAGDAERCIARGESRARAVKDILCNQYNIPENSLEIFGLGQTNLCDEFVWRYNDLDSDGKLIPEIAQKNRRVLIIDSASEDGKKFLQDWQNSQKS